MRRGLLVTFAVCLTMSAACADPEQHEEEALDELAAEAPPGKVAFEAIAQPAEGGSASVRVSAFGTAGCQGAVCIADPFSSPTFTATPNAGYRFVQWTGCTFAGSNPTLAYPPTFTNETCTAVFESTGGPGPGNPPAGSTATVRGVLPLPGSIALTSDAAACSGDSCQVPLGSDVTIEIRTQFQQLLVVTGFDGCTVSNLDLKYVPILKDGAHPTQEELDKAERERGPHYTGHMWYWDAVWTARLSNVQSDRTCTARMELGSYAMVTVEHGETLATSRPQTCTPLAEQPVCLVLPGDSITVTTQVTPTFNGWRRAEAFIAVDPYDHTFVDKSVPVWTTSAPVGGKRIWFYAFQNGS